MSQDDASKKAHENTLWKIAGNLISKYYDFLPSLVKLSWDEVKKQFPNLDGPAWNTWVQQLVVDERMDQGTANELKKIIDYPFPLNIMNFVMAVAGVTMTDIKAVMEVYALETQYKILSGTTPHPAPVDALLRSAIIDPGRTTENRTKLGEHGFNETQIDNMFLSMYKTLDEGTLRTLYLRGHINESRLYERMRELGYTDPRTREMVQTWEVLPGPQDLFTMVAKEAFEPDIYRTLGLDREFPSEQVEWLEKQGINRAWAEKYWIAHWDQPSIGQGFEMLHRNVISESELNLLFRAVEIPDFWRDKLTAIAYNPFTRVDVRRMHDIGILNDTDLIRSYMDLGFNSDKALAMANFTIRFNANNEKELTRGAVLESYNEGMISRSEAMAILEEQDYSRDLADYYLEMEDYNRGKSLQKQEISNTRDEYLLNRITSSSARTRLNNMGLRGDLIDSYLETWELDRYQYQALPSKSELDNFLIKGIINQGQWRDVMSRHGYTGPHIQWYLEDLKRELEVTRRMPTKADLTGWYKKNKINRDEFYEDMRLLGYADRYIELYIS